MPPAKTTYPTDKMQEYTVTDEEMLKVIGDFLEMGHVENIVALFRQEPDYFAWTGKLLDDERINVRLGLNVLFETFQESNPEQLVLALPSLQRLLKHQEPLFRGEAVSLLGMIDTQEARETIAAMRQDPSPQVREMVELVLEETP